MAIRRVDLQFAIVLALVVTARAEWETNECVQCHKREVLPITLGHSFPDWHASVHARGGVGCEKCHGGDPRATSAEIAHRAVRPADDPESMVHPTRLPATCGTCHKSELERFAGTVHARELAAKGRGATCFTCHEAMATSLPTPRELSARCGVCHEKPHQAQTALSMVAMTKTKLYRTRRLMDAARTANPAWHNEAIGRFHGLEREYATIQVKWHTFDTEAVIQETRDLLKLTDALASEADVMTRRGTK
jgi:hypothetical protein